MTKIQLRNAWFQVHKWIGLILAILIIPLCVTGSALVWKDGLDHLLHPARYASTAPATLAPATYVAKARAVLEPDAPVRSLSLPRGGGAVEVQAAQPYSGHGRPGRITVYLDPGDGHVIEKADSGSGIMRTLHILHGSLMIPGVGRKIVGWIGVAMLVSCLSGIWLWWPTAGRWVRGLRWRRHRNVDTNLHHLFGFWIALPLAALSLTGAWISFPQVFGVFDPPRPQREGPSRRERFAAMPLAQPVTGLQRALDRAAAVAPGTVREVRWPTDLEPEWTVETHGGTARIVDADAGASLEPRRERSGGTSLLRTMRTLHDGHDTPFLWQAIIFIGGILPAILAVTGIIMWWRARKWRAALKQRRRAAKT